MNGTKAADTRRAGERLRHALETAQHSFARASALLTEPSPENLGEALFHAVLGILKIAQADPERRAADRAEKILQFFAERKGRVAGPYSGT